jgi:ABC-type transporter Mla maintaining outer membrane lipid asymmetry ATPase subunit MlaF
VTCSSPDPRETTAVEFEGVSKQYGALRPLRIERLTVAVDDRIALMGLDQPAAEVFVNLITGASLPDAGSIRVFGRSTLEIVDSSDWLSTLDRFGIVSDRAPLIDALSVVQNLAMPLSLEIEPPPVTIREQAIRLAGEAGLQSPAWDGRIGDLDAVGRLRVRMARALALNPSIILFEHSSATLPRTAVARFGRELLAMVTKRDAASIALTMDQEFAGAVAAKTLTLDAASGRVTEARTGKLKFWS